MKTFDNFAEKYSKSMSEEGDFYHKTQIDPFIYSIVGNPKGKAVYDLGCGNGYMSRHFAKIGAKVFASDSSNKLIEIAKSKSRDLAVNYAAHDALDFGLYRNNSFDFVVANMVIHYIKDLDELFKGISRILKNGGIFAYSTNHFFRPTSPFSEWDKGEVFGKEKLFIKVTGYLKDQVMEAISGWDDKTKLKIYNRPLNKFVNGMAKYGLYIYRIEEPESQGFAKAFSVNLQKSHHIPTFLIVGAKKYI